MFEAYLAVGVKAVEDGTEAGEMERERFDGGAAIVCVLGLSDCDELVKAGELFGRLCKGFGPCLGLCV